jgi:hypothetical protein
MMIHNHNKVSSTNANNLALADVHADGAWVVVLEEIHGQVSAAADHVADGLACLTVTGLDGVCVTRAHLHGGNVARLGGHVVVGSLFVGVALELADGALAVARHGVVRGFEILLLGKHEHGGALLASHGGGDVKVEDGAGVAIDLAVVGCAVRLVRGLGVNGHDQVRVFVVAVEVHWAGVVTLGVWSGLGLSGRRRLSFRRRRRLGLSRRSRLGLGGRRRLGLGGRSRVGLSRRRRLGLGGRSGMGLGGRCNRVGNSHGDHVRNTLRLLGDTWCRLRGLLASWVAGVAWLAGLLRLSRLTGVLGLAGLARFSWVASVTWLTGSGSSSLGFLWRHRGWVSGSSSSYGRCTGRLRASRLGRASSTRTSRAKSDLDTLLLTGSRSCVDVVLAAVVDGAGVELAGAVVGDIAVRTDCKAVGGSGTDIALELGGRRSQDAAPSIGISEATVPVQAVAAGWQTTTDAILAVAQLAKYT